jgi:hypothetical protein
MYPSPGQGGWSKTAMGGGATFTESKTPAKACDPKRAASSKIRNTVSLFFILSIFLSSLFGMDWTSSTRMP